MKIDGHPRHRAEAIANRPNRAEIKGIIHRIPCVEYSCTCGE